MNTSSRVRVILLDDNEGVRSIFAEILEERGYEVFPYSDPGICPLQLERECLCSNGQSCADIIISDVDMPSMTGLEFIENQKKKNCKIRHSSPAAGQRKDFLAPTTSDARPLKNRSLLISSINGWMKSKRVLSRHVNSPAGFKKPIRRTFQKFENIVSYKT